MKKVVLCGLGAVGLTFGIKLNSCRDIDLKVVLDKDRFEKYKLETPVFNGQEQIFEYLLPEQLPKNVDLIIISTKYSGLESALCCIEQAVSEDTRIISLINGISSEEKIKSVYPKSKVLKSYFIGHSAVRNGFSVTQDGVAKIVVEKDEVVEDIFKTANIDYFIPDDIEYSMWIKFALNVFSNQVSAILNLTFGEMKNNKNFILFAKKIIEEVKEIARQKGVKNLDNFEKDSLTALAQMCDDGKTSMLQDILAKRKTEVDIFAGEIIRLGKMYNISTPYNQVLYDLIKIKEENNERSVYSG